MPPSEPRVALPVRFPTDASGVTPPPQYLRSFIHAARKLAVSIRENLPLTSDALDSEPSDYARYAAYCAAQQLDAAILPPHDAPEQVVTIDGRDVPARPVLGFGGWDEQVFAAYLRAVDAVERIFQHYRWRDAMQKEKRGQPRPLSAPPLHPDLLEDLDRGLRSLESHVAAAAPPPGAPPPPGGGGKGAADWSTPMQKKVIADKLGVSLKTLRNAEEQGVYEIRTISQQSHQIRLDKLPPEIRRRFTPEN